METGSSALLLGTGIEDGEYIDGQEAMTLGHTCGCISIITFSIPFQSSFKWDTWEGEGGEAYINNSPSQHTPLDVANRGTRTTREGLSANGLSANIGHMDKTLL